MAVVRGDGPAPDLVLALIDGLPLGSAYVSQRLAEQRGGEWHEYHDRDAHWWQTADLFDAVNQNTVATGQWKKGKAPKLKPFPRPGAEGKKTKKPRSIKDLWSQLGGAGPKGGGGGAGFWNPA